MRHPNVHVERLRKEGFQIFNIKFINIYMFNLNRL